MIFYFNPNFDDPLAAVDSKISQKLYKNVICDLLSGKTVFLVTHHVSMLQKVDRILCFENQRGITFDGKYEEFQEKSSKVFQTSDDSEEKQIALRKIGKSNTPADENSDPLKIESSWKLWWNYFLISGSKFFVFFWVLTLFLCQALQVLTDLQLAKFSNYGERIRKSCEVKFFSFLLKIFDCNKSSKNGMIIS